MIVKKNQKKDVNRKRSLFFILSLGLSITIVIVAFEWKSPNLLETTELQGLEDDFEDEI